MTGAAGAGAAALQLLLQRRPQVGARLVHVEIGTVPLDEVFQRMMFVRCP